MSDETISLGPGEANLVTGAPRRRGEHKKTCTCRACRGRRSRELRGLATFRAEREKRKALFAQAMVDQVASGARVDGVEAAVAAGYKRDGANLVADQLLENEDVRNLMRSALERKGITHDVLATLATDGLRANKMWRSRNPQTGDIDERADADWRSRGDYLDRVLKLMGVVDDSPRANAPSVNVDRALVVVHLPEPARAAGHDATCQCEECVRAWEDRTRRMLERRREMMKRYGIA